jgi:hypothetical protein
MDQEPYKALFRPYSKEGHRSVNNKKVKKMKHGQRDNGPNTTQVSMDHAELEKVENGCIQNKYSNPFSDVRILFPGKN